MNYFRYLIDVGRTFPVQKLFLEDVLGKVNYSLDSCSPYYKRTTKTSGPDPYGFEDDYVDDRRFPSDHIPDENLSPSQVPSYFNLIPLLHSVYRYTSLVIV